VDTPPSSSERYRLRCEVPLSTVISVSLMCFVLSMLTAGLALPFFLFRIGRLLIEHTEVRAVNSLP